MRIGIIGGGASGCTVAGLLGTYLQNRKLEKEIRIDLYEASDSLLRKVAATGNGRCNFTNQNMDAAYYTGGTGSFVDAIISQFSFQEACDFFEFLGIKAQTLESGMTYPRTLQAKTMTQVLETWLASLPVQVHFNKRTIEVSKNADASFSLVFKDKIEAQADIIVLSTGGSVGIAKDEVSEGYSLAKSLGHGLTRLHAGIVALRVEELDFCRALQGLKLQVGLYDEKGVSYEDDLLFTNYGLSGIGILKLSNQVLDILREEKSSLIYIDFLPEYSVEEVLDFIREVQGNHPSWSQVDLLSGLLPRDFIHEAVKEYRRRNQEEEISMEYFIVWLKSMSFSVKGSRKKDFGQITCGGISLDRVSEDLESLESENCFFTGEVLDVQGICGGYNLHWAWASAHQVGKIITNRLDERWGLENQEARGGA